MLPGMRQRDGVGLAICSLLMLSLSMGCMSQQLELTTRRALSTLPDLHYQQVIDNLATIASNSARLPYLAVVGQGSIQVTDNGNSVMGVSFAAPAARAGPLSIVASRNITGTWSVGTITSPDKIRDMQAVYQRTVAGRAQGHPAYGWLNIGSKRGVPAGASHSARHGDVAVWVMPEGMTGLSELTLDILDIATREDLPGPTPPLESANRPSVRRRNFQVPSSGPVFTPGGS